MVLDVQVGAFDGIKIPPIKGADLLLSNLFSLVNTCRRQSIPVVFVKDNGDMGVHLKKGQIIGKFTPKLRQKVIEKEGADAFADIALQEYLKDINARTIIHCGLHSDGCYSRTSVSAIALGYDLVVVRDCHGAISSETKDASTTIQEVNNLLLSSGARLHSTSEVIDALSDIGASNA